MDVAVRVVGHAVLHDDVDARHVDAARGHVGGDEHAEGAVAELLEGRVALRLADVAVQRLRSEGREGRRAAELVALALGRGEDDAAALRMLVAMHGDDVRQRGDARAGRLRREDGVVRHGGGRLGDAAPHGVDRHRVLEVLPRDALHPG